MSDTSTPLTLEGRAASEVQVPLDVHVPKPPSERGPWVLAGIIAALGVGVLVAVVVGLVGRSTSSTSTVGPPPVLLLAGTPTPVAPASLRAGRVPHGLASLHGVAGPSGAAAAPHNIVAQPPAEAHARSEQPSGLSGVEGDLEAPVSTRWMEGFYPIYEEAQNTFGVNWLLIASIHKQETAFSTAPSTYHGLNFAGCCGGPMQMNVTNGPVTTWDLVSNSYIYGHRPAAYNHPTATHPSIYDDFDAIMAAAHLLSADGAETALEGAAWNAAYDYYGHDATGVSYADEVLARAIGWSQHGFCINCGVEPGLLRATYAAYGAPVMSELAAAEKAAAEKAAAEKAAAEKRSAAAPKGTRSGRKR
jgi:hypothetical protein